MKEFITDLLTKANNSLSNTIKIDFGNTYYVSPYFSLGDIQGNDTNDNWVRQPLVSIFLNNDTVFENASSFFYVPQKNGFITEGNLTLSFSNQGIYECPTLTGSLQLAIGYYNIGIIFEGLSSMNGYFTIDRDRCVFTGYDAIPILGITKDLSGKNFFETVNTTTGQQIRASTRDSQIEQILGITESDFQNVLTNNIRINWRQQRTGGGWSTISDPFNNDNFIQKSTFYKNINFYNNDNNPINFVLPLPCYIKTSGTDFCSYPNISLIINKIK